LNVEAWQFELFLKPELHDFVFGTNNSFFSSLTNSTHHVLKKSHSSSKCYQVINRTGVASGCHPDGQPYFCDGIQLFVLVNALVHFQATAGR
jgi:hypothetical protein